MSATSMTSAPRKLSRDAQQRMYRRASRVLPGGANSNFRAWGEDTVYVDRGEGGHIWDIDGNEFIDLRMGYGAAILGHGDDRVDDAVNEAMRKGVSFSLTTQQEVEVAELISEMTGWVEMTRTATSGTEATMHAIRIARAYTRRDKIVKFEGQYHGMHDAALISVLPNDVSELGSRDNPVKLAWGRGIPAAVIETVIPAPYNDLEALRTVLEREGHEVAAVIIEPLLGNAQGILPSPEFLPGVRALTEEFGCVLIFDEVKTGFRLAKGGAAELFGIRPDVATYAKAMGNGYPAAAFGGSREIMGVLPGDASHGGTYTGNRVAASAAAATLKILRDTDALDKIRQTGETLQHELGGMMSRRGVPHVFTGHPSMFGVAFAEEMPRDYRGWADTDHELYDALAAQMMLRGIMPEPDSREPWFICEAHTGEDVERICTVFEESLDVALDGRA